MLELYLKQDCTYRVPGTLDSWGKPTQGTPVAAKCRFDRKAIRAGNGLEQTNIATGTVMLNGNPDIPLGTVFSISGVAGTFEAVAVQDLVSITGQIIGLSVLVK